MTGLLVAVGVLVLATAFGLWRRHTDGRLRPAGARPSGPPATSTVASARPAPAAAAAIVKGSGEAEASGEVEASVGGARPEGDGMTEAGRGDVVAPRLLAELGVEPGAVTLLQFSSAFCQPCRATRRILGDVAGMVPGVRHVEVDAESHLDVVRALDIWRTPTTLVLDGGGAIVRRATGVPRKAQVVAVLAELAG